MTRAQRLILSAALAALVALIALSVAGAFMGGGRAGAMFNSPVMLVFWILLAWLFMAGLVFFPRLWRRPGLLAMHVGCLLVLLGGMLGSRAGHTLLGRRLGIEKVRAGRMALAPGDRTNVVNIDDGRIEYDATLPFEVELKQAWVEHYGRAGLALGQSARAAASSLPARGPLEMADAASPAGPAAPREAPAIIWKPVLWLFGVSTPLDDTGLRLRVLEYLDSARAEPGAGVLKIRDAAGHEQILAAQTGQMASLADPSMTVRVENVFRNLRPHRRGEKPAAPRASAAGSIAAAFKEAPIPGRPVNPAVEVSFTAGDGRQMRTLVFYRPHMHGQVPAGVEVEYVFPQLAWAVADPNTHAPAMQVELMREQGPAWQFWLIADPAWPQPRISLEPLGRAAAGDVPAAADLLAARGPLLALAQPAGAIKAYQARVRVFRDGQPAAAKTLAVNHPLHYGGYHISLDRAGPEGTFVVFSVHSDTGLWLVYAGFALLVVGMAWQFYVVGLRRFKRLPTMAVDDVLMPEMAAKPPKTPASLIS